jgi:hypothetical protein
MDVENPLQLECVYPEIIPVANVVSIEVNGEPILEPKLENKSNVMDIIIIIACALTCLGLFGGFLLFLIWIYDQPMFD